MRRWTALVMLLVLAVPSAGVFLRAMDGLNNSRVRVVGRYVSTSPGTVRFDWPGIAVVASLRGSRLSVVLGGTGNLYKVIIDGVEQKALLTKEASNQSYVLSPKLSDGDHVVMLIKRTEGMKPGGLSELHGFTADGFGRLLPPPKARRLLFVGDSICCGMGALGKVGCDLHSSRLEDATTSFAVQTAVALDAEYQLACASGKGMLRNYGQQRGQWYRETMPDLWRRRLVNDATSGNWTFDNHWRPDVIVVHLGTNDFVTAGGPQQAEFALTYRRFLADVQSAVAKDGTPVPAVLACGPMCAACDLCRYVQGVAEEKPFLSFADLRFQMSPAETGCSGHPSALGHKRAAASLIPVVAAAAGWTVPENRPIQ